MRVLTCLVEFHDLRLVALAALVCLGGGFVTISLCLRARERTGLQRAGWIFMAAVAAGCSVWCTHFIAILAYRIDVPAQYDPLWTFASLLVPILGAAVAFQFAFHRRPVHSLAAGALLGLSVAGMHYLGMFAYRVDGIVSWDMGYVLASVVVAVLAGGLFMIALDADRRWIAFAAFTTCVVGLHFTGMAAVSVYPFAVDAGAPSGVEALAVAVTGGVLLLLGTGVASHLVDSDVTEQNVEVLRRLALSDTLTGLPNRANFVNHLEVELARAGAEGRHLAVAIIDLDKFKEVNDVYGHEAGDTVLRMVATRFAGQLHEGELIARMGGDEFAAVKRYAANDELHDFSARIERALTDAVRLDEFEILPSGSIGISVFPEDADTSVRLIGNADLAMYRAKAEVARSTCFYDASMDEHARERRDLAAEMRSALEQGRFAVHYQPQADFGTGTVLGYEALLRWNHPVRGMIAPAEFIVLAEETGLILPLGEWVLRTACTEAVGWEPHLRISVNLSAVQLAHGDLPDLVEKVLRETGLRADRLELEITETAIIRNRAKALHVMERIRTLGVSIAIDDFGTGYSSLATLRSFPFDRIKVDRSFVRDLASEPQSLAIMRAVLALGRSLNISVMVEGVETAAQLKTLQDEGCTQAQGYYFGYPLPPDRLPHSVPLAASA
ncbi:putative bifunctional diguanylate cyclase/phosphodiesterase [Ancylobacter pratisalsi]|uniref:EAL domain-containing protein n=1 Tax=Ancylobacter pratisalsi TaxID=1745854 RepID=A0A6P1YLG0_9HYPH|nr:EAL domain-containing protein [Ancylobacter pratisalsi]QIB33975.1 EAL domain-containing protein [Ancylobacter pratisalsi]